MKENRIWVECNQCRHVQPGANCGVHIHSKEVVVCFELFLRDQEEWPQFEEPEDDDPDYDRKIAKVERDMERARPTFITPQAYGDEETSGLTATVSTGENKIVFELSSDFSGSSKK